MSVISFDSSGMEMEPRGKGGDMIQTTKSSEESERNKEALKWDPKTGLLLMC